jgi:hypothetical protein
MSSWRRILNLQTNLQPSWISWIASTDFIPLSLRVGPMCFKCTCTDGFVWYACKHSTIATMLFDPATEVPPAADITRIKDRPAKVRSNPFNLCPRQENPGTRIPRQETCKTPIALRHIALHRPNPHPIRCRSPPPPWTPSTRAWTRARAWERRRAGR